MYATFCRDRKKKNEPEVSFEEWLIIIDDQKDQMISHDTKWYPTTTTTTATTVTPTTTPTTTTNTTTATTTAAAITANAKADKAATAADRKLKIMNGELGKGVVVLSEFQIDVLLDKLGVDMFDYYVNKLADWIKRNGNPAKSHYNTILKWWTEDCSC
jgi:hypothetical protein